MTTEELPPIVADEAHPVTALAVVPDEKHTTAPVPLEAKRGRSRR